MFDQITLIIILIGLILLLTFLLVRRIRSEKRIMAVIQQIDLDQFAEFARFNATDGSIQIIARKVSDFLKGSFGCEKIIFLRKQRANLELNYYHGIRGFRRDEFRFRYSSDLSGDLRNNPLPRPVTELAAFIPESVMERFSHHGFDQFFPIFWRDNLYGIYLIRSTMTTDSLSFRLLMTSLAQSLGAAYHIKWHEARYERIEQRKVQSDKVLPKLEPSVGPSPGIVNLIKNRRTDSLITQIGLMLKKELELGDIALLFEEDDHKAPIRVWQSGNTEAVSPPLRAEFMKLLSSITDRDYLKLNQSQNSSHRDADNSNKTLDGVGFKFAAQFPMSSRRRGIVAWNSTQNPSATANRLKSFSRVTKELVENAEAHERVEEMSNTDNLTGLANQRYFHKRLLEEINRATRYNRSLSLIIFDLDELKGINDKYGHLAGNAVLKRMGQILKSSIRTIDVIARYGGDEFCVIMPEADKVMCERFMERLRTKISSSKFAIDNFDTGLDCTISQGGAVFPGSGQDPKSLMHAADLALLQAKEMGRNRSVMSPLLEQSPPT